MTDHIFAITPDGDLRIILDDDHGSPAGKVLMAALEKDAVTPELMLACGGAIAPWFASVTFGGPDLQDILCGQPARHPHSFFRSPVAGLPMVHW